MIVTYCIRKGIHKSICDDSALISSMVLNDEVGVVECEKIDRICIGDGVGGNAGGFEASTFVMQQLVSLSEPVSDIELRKKIIQVNDSLLNHAKTSVGRERMATTLTGLFFTEGHTYLVQCGNTRAYVLQGRYLKQLTVDQTTYQWLISIGLYDAADACNKSEIRGVMGGGNPRFVDPMVVEEVFERGLPELFLLTSDGIHDVLDIDEIEDIVTSSLTSAEKVKKLIDTAVEHGSEDDCTAVLVEIY